MRLIPTSFGGNKNLKKPGVQVEWTRDLIEEYVRCQNDCKYFIKKYVKIVNVDRGLVPFELWGFQEEMIDSIIDNRFVICKMPRQVGKTTTTAATILWYVLFHKDFSAAILAHKEKQAREILGRIKNMYEHLPLWIQQGIVEWNKSKIILANGSKVMAASTSATTIRGETQSLVYLDEFGFVAPHIQEEFFGSVYPTVSSGQTTKVLITSTPNGMNLFYKIWHEAELKKNDYTTVSVHWSMVPGRDEAWKEQTIRNTSPRQFQQEFECEFLGSSNTLINSGVLARLTYSDPIERPQDTTIFEHAKSGHQYMITVDTSMGAGLDYSVFVVFDITEVPYRIVAKYRSNEISPLVYPNYVYNAAKIYNDAFVLVETNDIGGQVANILHNDMGYEGTVWTRSSQKSGTGGSSLTSGLGSTRLSLGLKQTKQTKRVGCANLKSLIESDKLLINDYDLLYELYRFIEKNGSYQAEDGEHDDIVMCCVMFAWMANQSYFKELTATDVWRSMVDARNEGVEDSMMPFGIIDGGHDEEVSDAGDDDRWITGPPLSTNPDRFDEVTYPIVSNKYSRKKPSRD